MTPDWVDWRTIVPDLSSDRITYLAFKALFDPKTMTAAEIQELAAAVVAHRSPHQPATGPN